MKTKIVLSFFAVLFSLSIFAQNDTTTVVKTETEWIAVKQSSVDSLTLNYLSQKGLVTYTTPKSGNNSVFVNVLSYLAGLLDSSLSSISKNTNKFYETPIGFWAVWGTFYHYVGNEILTYLLVFLFLIVITGLFLWLWRKNGIHKTVAIDPMLEPVATTDQNTADVVKYEVKPSNVKMQFWLLVTYILLFFIAACIL